MFGRGTILISDFGEFGLMLAVGAAIMAVTWWLSGSDPTSDGNGLPF